MSHIAFVGLGSNLADPSAQLVRAFEDLDGLDGTCLLARSSLYRSAPVGYLDQPDFVNAVAKLSTKLTPQALLHAVLQIEHKHGRERTFRNAPRTLDIDVLLYDDVMLHEHGLTIPHPQMQHRAFVLLPLLEIEPTCVIAGFGAAKEAMALCQDQQVERVIDAV